MSVISEPEKDKRSDGFLGALGIGCVMAAGLIAVISGGDLDRSVGLQHPPAQKQTDTPQKEPTHKSGKPFCTEVTSRAGVQVRPGDTVSEIAEHEMPEIKNPSKAAAMVLAMNGISPADPTIHPGEVLTIPAEACVIQR